MATSFTSEKATQVGKTPVVLYTVPVGGKAILIGCNVTNILNGIVPFSLYVTNGASTYYIRRNFRISNGANEEVVKGKIVMLPGDALTIVSEVALSIDVLASLLLGVA